MSALGLYGRDISELLAPQGERRQPMKGYDEIYVDIVDYIIRCTHRIWEEKDIGLIATHYSQDCPIHLMSGDVAGVEGVIAGTLRTLNSFPDRTLVGEAVIWSGNEVAGYHSSHRITSHATHQGDGEFGPPTGRRVCFTTIADCLCLENRIVEEWLVRDNAKIARDLGTSAKALGEAQAKVLPAAQAGIADWRAKAIDEVLCQEAVDFSTPSFPDPAMDPEEFARLVFQQIWNLRRLSRVREVYAPHAHWAGPDARLLFGHGEITGWIGALLSMSKGARIRVDHVGSVTEGPFTDIAVRWSFAGTHDSTGLYGPPSGAPLYILAISHWRTLNGVIVEETTIFDEIALWYQIYGGS
jgi:predicted ester cyclase